MWSKDTLSVSISDNVHSSELENVFLKIHSVRTMNRDVNYI